VRGNPLKIGCRCSPPSPCTLSPRSRGWRGEDEASRGGEEEEASDGWTGKDEAPQFFVIPKSAATRDPKGPLHPEERTRHPFRSLSSRGADEGSLPLFVITRSGRGILFVLCHPEERTRDPSALSSRRAQRGGIPFKAFPVPEDSKKGSLAALGMTNRTGCKAPLRASPGCPRDDKPRLINPAASSLRVTSVSPRRPASCIGGRPFRSLAAVFWIRVRPRTRDWTSGRPVDNLAPMIPRWGLGPNPESMGGATRRLGSRRGLCL
jgi:hypothetical protein